MCKEELWKLKKLFFFFLICQRLNSFPIDLTFKANEALLYFLSHSHRTDSETEMVKKKKKEKTKKGEDGTSDDGMFTSSIGMREDAMV